MTELKLRLHLIPESCFYSNLRNEIGSERWSLLSKKIRGYHNYTCQFCGWKQNPKLGEYTHLHEVFEFDEKYFQNLIDLECVCPTCHGVHHWGKSRIDGLDMNRLLDHACWVNRCTRSEFSNHIKDSFDEWQFRSSLSWKLGDIDTRKISERIKNKMLFVESVWD